MQSIPPRLVAANHIGSIHYHGVDQHRLCISNILRNLVCKQIWLDTMVDQRPTKYQYQQLSYISQVDYKYPTFYCI